ncbi:MAG TPA: PGF-pre-PGF domain-containing protein [Candidatus Methanoperedens sp.]
MISNNLKKMTISILLGLLLFWVVTGTAATISGGPTTTLDGAASTTYTYSGGSPAGGGSSGGGGGGGGGGASGENYTNIEVKEKYDLYIFKDKVTTYSFTNKNNPVLFVNITGNVNAGEINTAVEVLRNTSSLVKIPAPGIVYKNVNIWVGTYGFAVPKNIKEAVIRFRVENSWIQDNDLVASDVRMVRWDGSQWTQVDTSEHSKDGTYIYYEARTDSFSSFAIGGLKDAPVQPASRTYAAATPAVKPAESTKATATSPAEKTDGFEFLFAITSLCIVYIFWRKKI